MDAVVCPYCGEPIELDPTDPYSMDNHLIDEHRRNWLKDRDRWQKVNRERQTQ